MKLNEFSEKYNFHDSSIDKISFDEINNKLIIIVDFCFYDQQDYERGTPENGLLKVVFSGVKSYNGPKNYESEWWGILDGEMKDGQYYFLIENYEKGAENSEIVELFIDAESVEVEDLR